MVMALIRPGHTALLICGTKLCVPLQEKLGTIGIRHSAEFRRPRFQTTENFCGSLVDHMTYASHLFVRYLLFLPFICLVYLDGKAIIFFVVWTAACMIQP